MRLQIKMEALHEVLLPQVLWCLSRFYLQILPAERDELHKDIEQLCMQQAGPSYLGVATRMHFQR